MTNIMTNAMNKMTKMLIQSDAKLEEYGSEPYGQRKLTDKEQREKVENLTPQEFMAMIEEHGQEDVNKMLNKYWKED